MRYKILLLTLALAAALAAAVTAVSAVSAAPKSVTLTFLAPVENRVAYDWLIPQFERFFPNIHVEPTYVPAAQTGALMLTEFQAGNAPDLIMTTSGSSTNYGVFALGSQGKLLDLSGSPWVKRIWPDERKYLTVHRRIYAFPAAYTTSGIFANVDVMNALGVTPPKSFSELLAACQKISAAGKVPIALGMASFSVQINTPVNLIVDFVYSIDPNWTVKRNAHKVTFASSPLWHRMLQAILDMKSANCFEQNAEGVTEPQAQAMVASGQAAMVPGSQSAITQLLALNPNLHVNQFPWPADEAKNTVAGLSTGQLTMVINKNTSHPNEAKEFVNFLGRPKENQYFAQVAGAISGPQLSAGIVPAYASGMAPYLKSGKALLQATSGWPRPDKGLFVPTLITQIPGLFTGQRTVDQILQNMDAAWDSP